MRRESKILISIIFFLISLSGCNKNGIEGPAVEFTIEFDSTAVAERVKNFTIKATASDENYKYCNYILMEATPDELEGSSVVVHKGDLFSKSAAIRIEGYDENGDLIIWKQAESVFPDSDVNSVTLFLDSNCLDKACSDIYNQQCDKGDCTDSMPAKGVFDLDAGAIEEETFCEDKE